MPRNKLIQVRRDTAANWTTANPILAAGEPGLETDTGIMKVGDGVTVWASLAGFDSQAGSGASGDLFVGVGDFGNDTAAAIGRVGPAGAKRLAWLLDAAATEEVEGSVFIPAGWATVNVKALWVNATADAGDVVLLATTDATAAGDTVGAVTGAAVATTAPGINVAAETTLRTGLAVAAGKSLSVRVARMGADAADTKAGDIGLLGVLISKAS